MIDDDDDDDDDDIDENLSWSLFANKKSKKCSKNKSGRKAEWSESLLGDLVDIVISNDYYKTKLILTNTKNRSAMRTCVAYDCSRNRLTVVCETKWDETKWKSVVCEMEICSLRNGNL